MNAKLIRLYTLKTCIIGQLSLFSSIMDREVLRVATLELPDRSNKPCVSCIPAGAYICKRFQSSKFGNTFEICNVPDRQGILFHVGNTWKSTKGCIILGKYVNLNQEYLCESKEAFNEFMQALKDVKEFNLEIL